MNENNNNYYLNNINNKISALDLKKQQFEEQINEKSKVFQQNNSVIEKLKFTRDMLNEQYNSLIRLLSQQGIVFEITFSEYKPQQWENLFIEKALKGYEIKSKTGNTLMMLDDDISSIIKDIGKKDSYSLIVIRIMHKTALVQLRFT
ncbi:hypothetical protein LGK97_06820 [Clostridium sp. CS001]|uniref:hypothetical protein n=1 Tax=Clostridium sp. CS001 TaxID=2880648 RepID=UPI001CF5C188|nr:hypothetical protein [Clostridium sp. CS001]MCB2289478.1 hypothetical protein [Clostridium sp. CS001]